MMIPYCAPPPANEHENVNVDHRHPWRELGYLLTALVGGLVGVTLVLGLLVNTAVDWLPPNADKPWAIWSEAPVKNTQQQRLQVILNKLLSKKTLQAQVHWKDDPSTVNAVTLPGGHVVVYSGLLTKLNPTDDELAFILGHELGHIAHRDHWRSAAQAILWAWLCGLVSGQTDSAVGNLGLQTSMVTGLTFSRNQELAADRYGLVLMRQAGYKPQGAVTFFNKLNRLKENPASSVEILETHPANQARINALKRL